jgi:DNA-binding FadR family transcriptional regulator
MFEPIPERVSAVDACADAVRRLILQGELPAGERLPPERELALKLGASRVTLRNALARLAEARLLTVRHGSGYVVRDYRRAAGPELLPALLSAGRARDAAADLLLVRRHLAAAVLERLVGGVSAAALHKIAIAVDRMEGAADLAAADVEIVSALLAATGSPVLQLCLNPILAVLAGMPALREAMYAEPEKNLLGWRMLLEWLKTGDAASIRLVLAELERRDLATLSRMRRKK